MKGIDHEAEINGSGNFSHEISNVINPDAVTCFNWNALHVAASRGDVDNFRTLLASNSELVEALDSRERSVLHLASANGHVQIVEALIGSRPEMCLARDRDGANPLHLAAMRGQVKVLNVLFRANPLAARARVDRGERDTILHLCVKYNQLDCLEELLKKFKNDQFVNAEDDAGNTILHLAVALQKIRIIEQVLIHEKIDVNARNSSKQTAMDIQILQEEQVTTLKQATNTEGARCTEQVLSHEKIDENARNASKQTAMDIQILQEEQVTTPEQATNLEGARYTIKDLLHTRCAKRNEDMIEPQWIAEKRNALIIVAVLTATMAFQAGVIPPGGLWPDNNDGHRAGEAVMAHNYPNLYRYYLRSNTIGFVTSLSTILLLISELPLKGKRYWWALVAIMCVTFTSMAFTYAFSITVMTPKLERESLSHIVVVAVVVWCSVIAIVLLYLTICFITTIVGDKNTRGKANAAVKSHILSSKTQNHVQIAVKEATDVL